MEHRSSIVSYHFCRFSSKAIVFTVFYRPRSYYHFWSLLGKSSQSVVNSSKNGPPPFQVFDQISMGVGGAFLDRFSIDFHSFFIVFHRFSSNFDNFYSKWYFIYWKLSRDDSGRFQNIFESHFGLGKTFRSSILDLKPTFHFFDLPIFSVFLQNSIFESYISRSNL